MPKRLIFTSLLSIGGVFFGVLSIHLAGYLPFAPDSRLYILLGIKKPYVIGFQPFWLLERADKDYQTFINTFTYFGLTINSDGSILKLVTPQEEEPGWTTLKSEAFSNRLKEAKKRGLKLSLLLHNSNEASITAILDKPQIHAQTLISDVAPLMEKYEFKDLNLDIESFRETTDSDRQAFVTFIREVKDGLRRMNLGTLTIEVTPISLVKSHLIDATEIGRTADLVVLMTYDFHVLGSHRAGPVAPIGGKGKVREYDVETTLQEALKVIPKEKIILGIPLYGYEWETLSSIPQSATIPGGSSLASHRRVTEILTDCSKCQLGVDSYAQQPYVIFPNQNGNFYHQIFYEDEQSIKRKLELAKKYDIAGVALWALGYEGDKLLEVLKNYKRSFMLVK